MAIDRGAGGAGVGTGGITPADGTFIVGDGTNWVGESGATVRASLGLVAGGGGDIWVEKAGDTMTGALTHANLIATDAAGPYIANEAATTTNPTLIPNRAELDTGWGWASDELHAALGGVDHLGIKAVSALITELEFPVTTARIDHSGASSLTLRTDSNSLIISVDDNADGTGVLDLKAGGANQFHLSAASGIYATNAAGPAILNEAATTTNPTLTPNRAELDTGWGWASDELHAVLGGVDSLKISQANVSMYSPGTAASAAGIGTRFDLYTRTSDAGNAGDGLGGHIYYGPDSLSGTADHVYARIGARIDSPTDGAEDGMFDIRVSKNGGTFDVAQFYKEGLWIANNDADATAGPFLNLLRGRSLAHSNKRFVDGTASAGVANDVLGRIVWWGFDDNATPNQTSYAAIVADIVSPTDTAEEGALRFDVVTGGAGQTFLELYNSGTPSGHFNVSATQLHALNAAGPGLLNEAATATNPTLVPNRTDPDTGMGWVVGDELALVAGGAEIAAFNASGMILGNTGARVTQILDEDTMASDSATSLATQQSIKAYVDASGGGGLTEGTKQTVSGSSAVTFSSIPAGTSMIILTFTDIEISSASNYILIRLGDSGGVETSGYSGSTVSISGTTISHTFNSASFRIDPQNVNDEWCGHFIFTKMEDATDLWTCTGQVTSNQGFQTHCSVAGRKALSAELDRIEISLSAGTWTSGSLNILYM